MYISTTTPMSMFQLIFLTSVCTLSIVTIHTMYMHTDDPPLA